MNSETDVTQAAPLVKVAEAAPSYKLSERVLYDWIRRGIIPGGIVVKAGRSIYLRRLAFEEWLSGSMNGHAPQGGEAGR